LCGGGIGAQQAPAADAVQRRVDLVAQNTIVYLVGNLNRAATAPTRPGRSIVVTALALCRGYPRHSWAVVNTPVIWSAVCTGDGRTSLDVAANAQFVSFANSIRVGVVDHVVILAPHGPAEAGSVGIGNMARVNVDKRSFGLMRIASSA
jgi:hypothetical protein